MHPMIHREVFRVTVGPKGRIVLPAALRRQLNIDEGDTLAVRTTRDGYALEAIKPDAAMRRVQDMVAAKVPPEVDLVQELLDERRAEAGAEQREYEAAQRWLAEQRRPTGS